MVKASPAESGDTDRIQKVISASPASYDYICEWIFEKQPHAVDTSVTVPDKLISGI